MSDFEYEISDFGKFPGGFLKFPYTKPTIIHQIIQISNNFEISIQTMF